MQSTHFAALADELLASARAAPGGRSAHTLQGGREHRLRQTVIAAGNLTYVLRQPLHAGEPATEAGAGVA